MVTEVFVVLGEGNLSAPSVEVLPEVEGEFTDGEEDKGEGELKQMFESGDCGRRHIERAMIFQTAVSF